MINKSGDKTTENNVKPELLAGPKELTTQS